jgi:hypothetical protein
MSYNRLHRAVLLSVMIFFLSLVFLMWFYVLGVFAVDFTVSGVVVNVSYKEPVTNTDGSPLTDLKLCSVYYQFSDSDAAVRAKDINASSLTGGGNVSDSFSVPVAEGVEKDVDFWATCSDTSGNESKKSDVVRLRIDRLAPSSPS